MEPNKLFSLLLIVGLFLRHGNSVKCLKQHTRTWTVDLNWLEVSRVY